MSSPAVRELFGFSFLTSVTYVATRTIGVSAFLARAGSRWLPAIILISALVAIAVSALSVWGTRRFRLRRLIGISWGLIGVGSVAQAAAAYFTPMSIWMLGYVYVLAEIRGCLNTAHLTTLANDAFADSESRRPFAIVSSGAPAAGIVVGLIISAEASSAALGPVLLITAVVDFVVSFYYLRKARLDTPGASHIQVFRRDASNPDAGGVQQQGASASQRPTKRHRAFKPRNPFRLGLAALVASQIIVLTLVGYEWKLAVSSFYLSNEAAMVTYFGLFYAISDLVIITLQWVVSGRLLDRFGLGLGLVGLPTLLVGVAAAAVLTGSPLWLLVVFTLGEGSNVLRRSLHDPALVVAYTVLDPQIRSETILYIRGIVKPLSEAITAIALLILADMMPARRVTPVWLGMLPIWLLIATFVTMRFRRIRRRKTESVAN